MERKETPNAFMERKEMPNATAVLVLGILSIVGCCCYGILGLVFGIIAIVLSNGSIRLYNENPNPEAWDGYNNLKAGRICGIVGVSLSVLTIIMVAIMLLALGVDGFREVMQQYSQTGL